MRGSPDAIHPRKQALQLKAEVSPKPGEAQGSLLIGYFPAAASANRLSPVSMDLPPVEMLVRTCLRSTLVTTRVSML